MERTSEPALPIAAPRPPHSPTKQMAPKHLRLRPWSCLGGSWGTWPCEPWLCSHIEPAPTKPLSNSLRLMGRLKTFRSLTDIPVLHAKNETPFQSFRKCPRRQNTSFKRVAALWYAGQSHTAMPGLSSLINLSTCQPLAVEDSEGIIQCRPALRRRSVLECNRRIF